MTVNICRKWYQDIKGSEMLEPKDVFINSKYEIIAKLNKKQESKRIHEELETTIKNNSLKTKPHNNLLHLFTALFIFLALIRSSKCNFNIIPFPENQNLYFDKVADMILIKNDWKIVVFYNMESYWHSTKTYDKYLQTLKRTCDNIQDIIHCDVIILLRHSFSELEHYNKILLSQYTNPARLRRNRGVTNVRHNANGLVGVLDERTALKYREEITLFRENGKHIISLWKNQTSLIEAEDKILKITEQVIKMQLKTLNRHMNELDTIVKALNNNLHANIVVNEFNIGVIIAGKMLNNLKRIQNMLLNTVTDVYNKRFNSHLLAPEQLISELSIISSKLPKDVTLPIDSKHTDLRTIHELLKIKTRILEDIIIFEIKLPLISRDAYQILRLIPIPRTTDQTGMITIITISEYISVNMKKDSFISMNENDVKSCIILAGVFYCHTNKPIIKIKDDKPHCEKDNSGCRTILRPCKNNWVETALPDNYFYFCCDRCEIRTMCGDHVTAHQLIRAGLISIDHGCIIKTDSFTVYAQKYYQTDDMRSADIYAPIINVPKIIFKNKTKEKDVTKIDETIEQNEVIVPKDIHELPITNGTGLDINYHDIHHYAMIYVIIGVLSSIGMIISARHMQCQRRRSPPKLPPPIVVSEKSRPYPPVPPRSRDRVNAHVAVR